MSQPTFPTPTLGAAVLLSNGGRGWDPGALIFAEPLVLVRQSRGVVRVFAAGVDTPFHTSERDPFDVLEEVVLGLKEHLPKAGPGAGKPMFPVSLVALAYEFGRRFSPHEGAFPHAAALEDDEFFAAVHIDAYRPDSKGGTERIGYAGVIPEGWMAGAPALRNGPPGHEAPPIIPHPSAADVPFQTPAPVICFESYARKVEAIRGYLASGDIYQANLTVPLRGTTPLAPEAIFDAALNRGGAAFGATMIVPGGTVLSFSPELYIRRRGKQVETRPIKGTRRIPNHAGGVADATEALKSSEKDRAEHIMIVDLERNDLGRVCRYGSVKADPLMRLVEHPTVLHMESRVVGELDFGKTLYDILSATFPGGSVTGAPKKRAMEIIGELEEHPRGIYCGALGWIDSDGDCDLNLPIRTALIRPDGTIEFSCGGGIVADSDPKAEWEELHHKAQFFLDALAAART